MELMKLYNGSMHSSYSRSNGGGREIMMELVIIIMYIYVSLDRFRKLASN
jgi:hypothetical protein